MKNEANIQIRVVELGEYIVTIEGVEYETFSAHPRAAINDAKAMHEAAQPAPAKHNKRAIGHAAKVLKEYNETYDEMRRVEDMSFTERKAEFGAYYAKKAIEKAQKNHSKADARLIAAFRKLTEDEYWSVEGVCDLCLDYEDAIEL